MDVWERLCPILAEVGPEDVAYVYRLAPDGKVIKPYLLRYPTYPDLPATLRDQYDGGRFKVLIRRGRKMIFSGEISIGRPLRR